MKYGVIIGLSVIAVFAALGWVGSHKAEEAVNIPASLIDPTPPSPLLPSPLPPEPNNPAWRLHIERQGVYTDLLMPDKVVVRFVTHTHRPLTITVAGKAYELLPDKELVLILPRQFTWWVVSHRRLNENVANEVPGWKIDIYAGSK